MRIEQFVITDIFEQGSEIDDSEAVQTARRAKEL